jgi:predicted secreted protein
MNEYSSPAELKFAAELKKSPVTQVQPSLKFSGVLQLALNFSSVHVAENMVCGGGGAEAWQGRRAKKEGKKAQRNSQFERPCNLVILK